MLNQFPQCAAFHIKSGFLYEMQTGLKWVKLQEYVQV